MSFSKADFIKQTEIVPMAIKATDGKLEASTVGEKRGLFFFLLF